MLDFDDTLFPTTWLCTNYAEEGQTLVGSRNPKMQAEVRENILAFAPTVKSFILSAKMVGMVFIVTNAVPGWVHAMITRYLPEVDEILDDVHIIYAREVFMTAKKGVGRRRGLSTMAWKVEAMEQTLANMYGAKSWKNIISMGDGPDEFHALQAVAEAHTNPVSSNTGKPRPCRVKAVKCMANPTLYELAIEIELLMQSLPAILQNDGSLIIKLQVDLTGTELENAMLVNKALLADRAKHLEEMLQTPWDQLVPDSAKAFGELLSNNQEDPDGVDDDEAPRGEKHVEGSHANSRKDDGFSSEEEIPGV